MILLDTHVWIWWVNGLLERIPQAERELIAQAPMLAVSVMSCLEMAWLVRRGRIELEIPLAQWFDLALEGSEIQLLPLTPRLAERAAELPEHHKDPADRVIIATAIEHRYRLISLDEKFPLYMELGELLLPIRQ
ncbi:MAG: type II toxin-antitoxin system VapC family toxin [Candidatus Sericytochromatia bacterium]